jgi:hypothetical protein
MFCNCPIKILYFFVWYGLEHFLLRSHMSNILIQFEYKFILLISMNNAQTKTLSYVKYINTSFKYAFVTISTKSHNPRVGLYVNHTRKKLSKTPQCSCYMMDLMEHSYKTWSGTVPNIPLIYLLLVAMHSTIQALS